MSVTLRTESLLPCSGHPCCRMHAAGIKVTFEVKVMIEAKALRLSHRGGPDAP